MDTVASRDPATLKSSPDEETMILASIDRFLGRRAVQWRMVTGLHCATCDG
jgi:hypothetical protein